MSNLPTPTSSSVYQIPSPSVSSSRRTSLDTATRSSTVSSPALGPTSIPSSTSGTQPAQARRNRAALRDYYGLKVVPQHAGQSKGREDGLAGQEAQVPTSELDAAGFDAQAYVKGVLEKEGLEGVLRTEGALVGEVKSLDGERKALVYDNYSKLITATDTIRRMRANMDPLAPTTSTLAPAVAHIAGTAQTLAAAMKERVASNSLERHSSAPEIRTPDPSKSFKHGNGNEMRTVKWVTTAADRYRVLIERGENEAAEKDWEEVRPLLDKWCSKGVAGAVDVRKDSAEASISPGMLERARSVANEHAQLSHQLAENYNLSIAKKIGELSTTTEILKEWERARTSFQELQQLLLDRNVDEELRNLAADEVEDSRTSLQQLSNRLKASLVPKHPFAHLPCLLELKPGAGGDEAGIFAGDLLRMYHAFCKRHRLQVSVVKLERIEGVGAEQIQEAIIEIHSDGAYNLLRCEAGVHRVQRVPATESKGRTHTSAVSVLVLPSFPENVADILGVESFDDPNSDYYIDPGDVRTDVMRARGAGGQHVNTTDSAVRLTHEPTGTVVAVQESRSQHKNRQKAWQILRARIAQSRREAREEELAQLRLSVVGVAKMGRGDKIRTYNWGQQRVTDHRSGVTLHNLDDVMEGGQGLDEVMQSVRAWRMERDLEALAADDQLAKKSV